MNTEKTQTQTPKTQTNQTPQIYAYTQHTQTIRVIEETCNQKVVILQQDRTRDPVEDVLRQLPPETLTQGATLYVVLPVDKLIELKTKAPQLRIRLLQLDGSVVERITGKPYDPKIEYPPEVIKQALRVVEVKGGKMRYTCLEGVVDDVVKRGIRKIAIFNDTLREGFKLALQRIGVADIELVKTCDNSSDCVEVNPPGYKSGYRISFPGTAGRLSPEQMAEMLLRGDVRVYYAEIEAQEVSLCQ